MSGLGIVRDGMSALDGVNQESGFQSKGNLGVARKMNNMKKLMIAAAASAIVGGAFAIESANIVG